MQHWKSITLQSKREEDVSDFLRQIEAETIQQQTYPSGNVKRDFSDRRKMKQARNLDIQKDGKSIVERINESKIIFLICLILD